MLAVMLMFAVSVLEHLAAFLFTFPASAGAALHVLVLGKRFASFATSRAGVGAGLADQLVEWATA